jgi:hypothetical protein
MSHAHPSEDAGIDERLAAEAEGALEACCQPVLSVVPAPPPTVNAAPVVPPQEPAHRNHIAGQSSMMKEVAAPTGDAAVVAALAWIASPIERIPKERQFIVDWIAWSLVAWVPVVWLLAIFG